MATNAYCEKHEWPAGMGEPCPDCIALASAKAETEYFKKERDAALLQNQELQNRHDALKVSLESIMKFEDQKRAEFAQLVVDKTEALRLIEEKNRALFNIINIIGPTSAAKCEGCLFEMEEALRIARAAFEDKPIEKRKWSKRPR